MIADAILSKPIPAARRMGSRNPGQSLTPNHGGRTPPTAFCAVYHSLGSERS